MSIASVAEEKYQKIEEDTLPQVDESDKIINEMRRKQIARLNAALAAIKEIKEGNYSKNDCVVGEGIVLEDHTSKQSTLPIPRARTSRYQRRTARSLSLAARRRRTAGNSSLAARRQRIAGNSSLAARRQRTFTPFAQPPQSTVKEKVRIIILYER